MLELRAEEVVFCVGCSTRAAELKGSDEEFVGDTATKFEAFAVVPNVDTEVEEERAFVDRVSEKLLIIVAT